MGQPIDPKMLCNPPGELLTLALPMVSSLFETQIALIPDSIPIFEQNKLEIRAATDRARLLMRLSPLLPLVLLALMSLLAVRSFSDWLKWWGIPLSIAGAGSLLMILVAGPISGLVITYAAGRENSTALVRLAASGMDVIQAILWQINGPMAIQAAIILLAGSGMLVGTRMMRQNESKKKQA
jgi:hypothetical protein